MHLREATLIFQQQTAKDGQMDIELLLKEYRKIMKMEGVDAEMAFRFNVEIAFVCYRSGNYDVCILQCW